MPAKAGIHPCFVIPRQFVIPAKAGIHAYPVIAANRR
jgi:hypothetical protein